MLSMISHLLARQCVCSQPPSGTCCTVEELPYRHMQHVQGNELRRLVSCPDIATMARESRTVVNMCCAAFALRIHMDEMSSKANDEGGGGGGRSHGGRWFLAGQFKY